MIGYMWRASRGYRLRPWRSPYLRWRIETYWGLHAETIGFKAAEKHKDLLRTIGHSRGRIRRFFEILQDAKDAADDDNAAQTVDYIEEALEERATEDTSKGGKS